MRKPFPSMRRSALVMLTLLMTTSVSLAEIDVDVEDPATGGEATELSIAPLDHVDYPSDRPQWINQSSEGQQNDEETILISVVSPPQPTPDAAAEMMEVMTRGVVENYIDQKASLVREPIDSKKIEVEMDWIRDELITRRYDGEVKVGEHTQYESACLLSLTLDHQETLDRLIENHQLMHRFGVVGVFALGGFHSLVGGSIVFGGLASRQQRRQAT